MLPANIGARIQGTGLDVSAVLEPARQVGGDLFEVLHLGPDRVLVAVGDVSGKGIPAALFMAVAMTLLRSLARQGNPPDRILRQLNDEPLEQNPRGMFVTLQCLVFDLAARRVTCASAGHHAAVRVRHGQPAQQVFTTSGRVLGLLPAAGVVCETLDLQVGDTFVLFTDGVSEAFDADDELFGDDRLLTAIDASPNGGRGASLPVCWRRCGAMRPGRSSRTTSPSFPSTTPARDDARHACDDWIGKGSGAGLVTVHEERRRIQRRSKR